MALDLPFPPTPENAARFAALAVDAALNVGNVVLDYSAASLGRCEEFLGVHGGERREAAVLTFGCYVGEIFVRAGLGRWRATDGTPMKGMADVPLLVELGSGDYCNPLGRVRKFLDGGPGDGLVRFWEAFAPTAVEPRKPWWRRLLGRWPPSSQVGTGCPAGPRIRRVSCSPRRARASAMRGSRGFARPTRRAVVEEGRPIACSSPSGSRPGDADLRDERDPPKPRRKNPA